MDTQGFISDGKFNIDGQEQDEEALSATPLASKFAESTNIVISRASVNTVAVVKT